jgi:hypothetical protein
VLLVINAVSILLAGAVTLWYLGYRPEGWTPGAWRESVTSDAGRVGLATVGLLVLVASAPTVTLVEHVTLENAANEGVQDVLERPVYRDLSLVSVDTEYTDLGLLGDPQEVTVRVRRPVGEPYPSLASDIASRIGEGRTRPVAVTIEFIDQQTATP